MQFLLIVTFLLAPAYLVRFNLAGFPTNLLMLWVFFVWLIFFGNLIIKKQLSIKLTAVNFIDKKLLVLILLFLLAGIVSLFVNGFSEKKLAQFVVLFLQPIVMFFISRYIFLHTPKSKSLFINACYLLLALMGVWSAIQYFTLFSLPAVYWGNSVEPKRALGFFSHPNFYALFSAPLLALLIPDLFASLKAKSYNLKALSWLLGALGLFLSLSRAGWIGLAAAILVYLITAANNKIRKIASIAAIIIVMVVMVTPNLRYRLLLPFYGEKSAVSRVSLWQTGWKGIKESPIFGLGLTGFAQNWQRLNTDPGLATDSHNFPHNIFLNFWVETGLLGLISLIGLMGLYIYRGLRHNAIPSASDLSSEALAKEEGSLNSSVTNKGFLASDAFARNGIFKLSIALFLIALITQGLIDNPYFKNDLAMVFWIILSLTV